MKVFIENEAGSDQKNLYDEKTLRYIKSHKVSRPYPYPYGFILDTTSDDGDNLDCFIITNQSLKAGETVEAQPIGMLEQVDDGEQDHNILAILENESSEIDKEVKNKLTHFIKHVFDHLPKKVETGNFLDKKAAEKLILRSRKHE